MNYLICVNLSSRRPSSADDVRVLLAAGAMTEIGVIDGLHKFYLSPDLLDAEPQA